MFRRFRIAAILAATLTASGACAAPASACPMCSQAIGSEEDNRIPQAYMFSILFMLAMPATLLTGFGIGFYRLSKSKTNDATLPAQSGEHHLTPDGTDPNEFFQRDDLH